MKIMKYYKQHLYILLILSCTYLFASCDSLVYDDLEKCDRGIYINVYEQTECASSPSYPSEIKKLNIYAFDANDVLAAVIQTTDVSLSADRQFYIPLEKSGSYYAVVWGNVDDKLFETIPNKIGSSTKKDLLLYLRKNKGLSALNLKGQHIYVGSTPTVQVGEIQNLFAYTKANVREITNRIRVMVEGLIDPEEYTIEVSSANTHYTFDGQIFKAEAMFYPTKVNTTKEKNLIADFNVLKLESGRASILTVKKIKTGEILFQNDLVGAILLSEFKDTPSLNLRCINDFDVLLKFKHCDCPDNTYVGLTLIVNNWSIHSYDIFF
ncbi:Fimbrillin-A associated anchor proteins Mfa1 and Mfa2 [Porphyromonas macacae]|uniref:Fimbrillin-A associated anchor proteins Mfa1 and Mfa2 n=3 Tax=Porphyromonas macacae TaxID=28115 RepID=A0A379DJW3_9PORP|nr:Fimbrillin-A associated anchor proteins Mfa1 and Mfa2 [Porphyromonas macacae]